VGHVLQVEQSARPPSPGDGSYRPALTVDAINSLSVLRDVESNQMGEPDHRSERGTDVTIGGPPETPSRPCAPGRPGRPARGLHGLSEPRGAGPGAPPVPAAPPSPP
jgi:hypothetical protein